MLNINGKIDPNYRYKMHKLQTKTKKNNKTYFHNLEIVSNELQRDSKEILKWYGYTLGVNSNTKDFSLNGQYNTKKLQEHLQNYITNHVLCDVCGNPETHYKSRKGNLRKKCASCGESSKVKLHPKMEKFFK
jgi:translation initiation factor 2 beta subunit (eIF-2beta)/eIF-5